VVCYFAAISRDLSNMGYLEGIPIQSNTDCGSETVEMYGFANALRYIKSCFS
jgi:hypothetical protein